jgi:hypothetical protein
VASSTGSTGSTGGSGSTGGAPHNPSGPLRAKRITSTSITLSWGAPKGGPAPTRYGIAELVQGNHQTIGIVRADKHQFTVKHLRPHHRYRFVVWSFSADNQSDGISGTWRTT